MSDTDQEREDELLRRMLKTRSRPHKPTGLTPPKTKKPKPMPAEQETPNPAPDKDYADKQLPFTDGDENGSDGEDE